MNNNMTGHPNVQHEQQQQKFNQEATQIQQRRVSENKVDILDLISEEQFTELKEIIQNQFGVQASKIYNMPNQAFLDLYVWLYEKKETTLSLTQLGVVSDMLFGNLPLNNVEKEMTIKEFLEFKISMEELPKKFHATMLQIKSDTEREVKAKMEKKIITL